VSICLTVEYACCGQAAQKATGWAQLSCRLKSTSSRCGTVAPHGLGYSILIH